MFEQLMDNLLRAENPGKEVHIIKAAQGDGGIDVYVHQEEGIDVYQCKFFMDEMNASRWTQVKDSFKRVLEFINSDKAKGVKLLNWFLCVPREMWKEDIAKWNEFCEDRKSLGIGLRYIDGNEIIRRLQECDRLRGTDFIERYFAVPESARAALKGVPRCLTSIPTVNRTVGLVGRETVMQTVLSLLEEEDRLALVSGLGGIGKTAVMQWICNDLKNKGNYVAWIDCGGSLKEDLLVLGKAFGISEKDPDTAYDMILNAVKTRLDGSLYLFMDNLSRELSDDELGALNSLNAHVMVTSRQRNSAFPIVDLDVLEPEAALTMFFKYYNEDCDRQSEAAAQTIVSSAHRHTLLVELLAKAARKAGGTLERFSEKLEKEGVFDVFKRKLKTSHDKNENLTIEECVMKLYEFSNLSEEQRRIMKLFSIFTPEREIYWEVAEWAGLDMDAVDELVELAWLEQSEPENNYRIHQIIKDSVTRQMKNSGEVVQLEDYGELLDKAADTDSYMPQDLEYTKVRERLGTAEDIAKNLSGRTDAMLEVEEIAEEKKGILSKAARLFNNVAGVYDDQGEYEKALEYYGKALVIFEQVLGPAHPDTGTTYNNMASVYDDQGEYGKALEYYGKALAICERVYGSDHPDTGTIYSNMALVYDHQGEYGKALEYNGKALGICERVYGSDHPDTGTTYSNMALVYDHQGEYGKALEYNGKALSIRERVLGPDHPDTGTTYNNMAGVYSKQGEYGKALDYFEEALAIRVRVLGPDHPSTGTTYNNMAFVFRAKGDYEKALAYYEKALAIRRLKLGENHHYTKDAQLSVDEMKQLLKREGEAE